LEKEFLGHLSGIKSLQINEQDNILASGSKDGSGRLWNLKTSEFTKSLAGHKENVCSLSFCPGKKQIASGSWDQKVMVFNY
jgi:WD40 repeat protein